LTPLECCQLFLKAWEIASPREISRLFAEGGPFNNPLQSKPLVGPNEIRDAVSIGLSKIQNIKIQVSDSVEVGSRTCLEGYFHSRKRLDNSRFDFTFSLVLELRRNKIARLTEYFDTAGLR
jgi:hypothetical protein